MSTEPEVSLKKYKTIITKIRYNKAKYTNQSWIFKKLTFIIKSISILDL